MIAGVAAGLAVHLNIPVKVVRAAFVLLLLLSRGAWGIVYLILMVTMPTAKTEEDIARAYGQVRI
jgi:phage shock protein PspC (stress-responsive transcriptional regulator)